MARPKPRDLPPENQRIWRAWQDAKQRDPALTQGDFALTVWPAPKGIAKARARKRGEKLAPFDQTEIHKRERAARGRYLRLVFEGKRTPKQLNARADRVGGQFNVTLGTGKNTKSFNLYLPPGVSRIDSYLLLDDPETKRIAAKVALALAARYGADIDISNTPTSIRGIRQARAPEQIFRARKLATSG